MKRTLLPAIAAFLCMLSCTPEQNPRPSRSLVVEAWIESGEAPVVMVTYSAVPGDGKILFSELAEYVEKWAKVTLDDGEKRVVLTGMPSKDYLTRYVYTTGRMFGEAGKTYTLTVEAGERSCSATATVPRPVGLDSLEPVPYGSEPGAWIINARFHDDPDEENCYVFFSRIEGVDSLYVSNFANILDDSTFTGTEVEMPITQGSNIQRTGVHKWFSSGETVHIKFCTTDAAGASILKRMNSTQAIAEFPLLVSNTNLDGNVDGALGYFIGYGRNDYKVTLP